MDQYYVDEGYVDVNYFATEWHGSSSQSVTATLTATGTTVIKVFGSAALTVSTDTTAVGSRLRSSAASSSAQTTVSGSSKRIRTGVVNLPAITTQTAVAGRRLHETVLPIGSIALTVSAASRTRRGAILLSEVVSGTTVAAARRRGSVAFGSTGATEETLGSYIGSGIPIPGGVTATLTASLNRLIWDDYVYIIPNENRTYKIPEEIRVYSIEE